MADKKLSKINIFDHLDIKAPDWVGYDADLVDAAVLEGRKLQEQNRNLEKDIRKYRNDSIFTAIRWFFSIFAFTVGLSFAIWGINWAIQDVEANKKIVQFEINYYKSIYKQGWEDSKLGYPESLLDAQVKEKIEQLQRSR